MQIQSAISLECHAAITFGSNEHLLPLCQFEAITQRIPDHLQTDIQADEAILQGYFPAR